MTVKSELEKAVRQDSASFGSIPVKGNQQIIFPVPFPEIMYSITVNQQPTVQIEIVKFFRVFDAQ